MIRDRASDLLDQHLRQKYHIRLITPHKNDRDRKSIWGDLELRLATRRGHYEANFLAMLQVSYFVILRRHL
jgi:hypothetical protein